MFEGIVAFLLNKFLGKYVIDLDSENLNIGVFSGTVQLTDLKLKPEALYELDLPIEIKAGCIGKLSIDIPWTTLYTDPVLVHAEDILIVAVPITDHDYDDDQEKRLLRARKQKILDDVKEASSPIRDAPIESQSFFENILAQIVNNVQISIQNVHIRYEDIVSIPGCAICAGIAFQSVTAMTTNSKWKPSQIDAKASKMFKLVKLETFYAYLNPRCNHDKLVKNDLKSYHWTETMKNSIYNCSIFDEEFDFVLKPIIIKVKLIYNKTNEHRVPKLLVDCMLQDASVQLSDQQYQTILSIIESFKRIEELRVYWKYRPNVPVKGNAKLWWKYAYKAVRDAYILPYTWKHVKKYRDDYNKYKMLYKERLLHPNDSVLKVDLQKIEDTLNIETIIEAQEEVRQVIAKEHPELVEPEPDAVDTPWPMFGTGIKQKRTKSANNKVIEIKSERENLWSKLSKEEKSKLYDVMKSFGDSPLTESSVDIEEYFAHKINFTLANCTLSLINGERDILLGSITHFLISCETRPSVSGFKLSLRAESLLLEGANDYELIPLITADGSCGTSNKRDIFAIDFEINPLHIKAQYAVKAEVEPIEIAYHQRCINEIINFFQRPTVDTEKVMKMTAESMIHAIEVSKATVYEYAIEKQSKLFLNINLKAFTVIIPEGDSIKKDGQRFVIELGKFIIKSDNQRDINTVENKTK